MRGRIVLPISAAFLVACGAAAQVFGPSGPELRVNTYTTGVQGGGAVAMDDAGNFVVLWSGEGPDGGAEVYGQRYTFNAPAGTQFRVNTTTTAGQGAPAIAGSATGDLVMTWDSYGQDGQSGGVFAQRMKNTGALLGGEFRVNTTTAGYQGYIAVASDPSGGFVVVWTGPGYESMPDVFGQRYDASGAAQGGEFRVNTYTTGFQGRPAVARSSTGFVVVWQSGDQPAYGTTGVYGQRYGSDGAPLGGEFFVNSVYSNGASNSDVGMDGSGNFVVVWQALSGADTEIFAHRYDAGGSAVGAEFRVNSTTTDFQTYPAVSADPLGTFVVTWQSSSLYGGLAGVFAQRYAASGTPRGSEFRVNTTTAGYLFNGRVDHDLSGNFVVTWTQGESGSQDVRLRRYCVSLAGDANGDDAVDVSDVFYLINYLFAGGAAPMRNSDANGDGSVNVSDVFYLINYLFAAGPPPSCPINLV